jgi:hypothetical protein
LEAAIRNLYYFVNEVGKRATKDRVPTSGLWHSQLATVAQDLAHSVCVAAKAGEDPRFADESFAEDFLETQSERLREVLGAIPSAFHHVSLRTSDGKQIRPFALPPSELPNAIKDVANAEPEKIIKAYGTIWRHPLDWPGQADKSKIHADGFMNVLQEGVEWVAEFYLASDDLVSPLLEWAIVDALVYWRIQDFASSRRGQLPQTPQGQLIDGPLLPKTGMLAFSKLPGVGAKGAADLVGEGIALAATWWIAGFLAGPESLGKWILFTGWTATRWITAAIRGKGDSQREAEATGETNLRMLWDIGIAHDRIPTMNVALLRHLLFRLEERGAAFSPAVYAILDKRARREGKAAAMNAAPPARSP